MSGFLIGLATFVNHIIFIVSNLQFMQQDLSSITHSSKIEYRKFCDKNPDGWGGGGGDCPFYFRRPMASGDTYGKIPSTKSFLTFPCNGLTMGGYNRTSIPALHRLPRGCWGRKGRPLLHRLFFTGSSTPAGVEEGAGVEDLKFIHFFN